MKIAIIGGSGFVGTKLIQNLLMQVDTDVVNIDKQTSGTYPDLTYIANVLDQETLTTLLNGIDLVVLLAAEHRDDVSPVSCYYEVNVRGMQNTLQAMEANAINRIVFTSSVAIYGLDKNNPNEEFPADPFNHYGKSKWQAEQVLQQWYATHLDWNINIIRPTVIFGQGNRGNVYNLLAQIASGKFLMVGQGNNEKSMSYIGNIIAFICFLINEKKVGYHVFNYSDTPDFTTNDLVKHTGAILGKQIPSIKIPYALGLVGGYGFDLLGWLLQKKLSISSVRVRKFCAVTKFDTRKALSSGFRPPHSLEEGLRYMLEAEFKQETS